MNTCIAQVAPVSVSESPSDTRANHTRSELDIDRSLVWLVSLFQPKLPVEPLQRPVLTSTTSTTSRSLYPLFRSDASEAVARGLRDRAT
jgi:hypothetical protein